MMMLSGEKDLINKFHSFAQNFFKRITPIILIIYQLEHDTAIQNANTKVFVREYVIVVLSIMVMRKFSEFFEDCFTEDEIEKLDMDILEDDPDRLNYYISNLPREMEDALEEDIYYSGDEEAEEEEEEEEEEEFDEIEEEKTRVLTRRLKVAKIFESELTLGDDLTAFELSQARMRIFKEEEQKRQEILEKRNSLESAIYEMKDIANDTGAKRDFLSEGEREDWISFTSELEEFLFFGRPKESELNKKLKSMNKLRRRFDIRWFEAQDRDLLIDAVIRKFNDYQNQIQRLAKANEDLPDSKISEAQELINIAREWVLKRKEKLKKQDNWETPTVTKRELVDKKEEMSSLVFQLRNYKKPVEKKKYGKRAGDKKESVRKMREKLMEDMKLDPKMFANFTDTQMDDLLKNIKEMGDLKGKEGKAEGEKAEEGKGAETMDNAGEEETKDGSEAETETETKETSPEENTGTENEDKDGAEGEFTDTPPDL